MAGYKSKKKSAEDKLSNETWPKITKGSHLTVIEHEDGRRELQWDDDALLRDVQAAILKAESTIPVTETKPKRTRKAKQ